MFSRSLRYTSFQEETYSALANLCGRVLYIQPSAIQHIQDPALYSREVAYPY